VQRENNKTLKQHTLPMWSVPASLVGGVLLSLAFKWPIYIGLLIGYVGSVAYTRGLHSWHDIWMATWRGMTAMWKVCSVLILVGAMIAVWMISGTIPALMHVFSSIISSRDIIWAGFLVAALLSMVIGSSIASWGILAPPLMTLCPPHLSPIVAGAIISGGMVGDRSSPMSTSVIVMSQASGIDSRNVLRQLNRTMLPPFLLTLLLFFFVNLRVGASSVGHLSLESVSSQSLVLLIPPILVIGLAVAGVPLVWNLSAVLLVSAAYPVIQGTNLIVAVRQIWGGYPIRHQAQWMHIGGIWPMSAAVVLILIAGAFQRATQLGGAIEVLASRAFNRLSDSRSVIAASFGLGVCYTFLMGSQTLSILMTANTIEPQFKKRAMKKEAVLQVIADSSELFAVLVPWNLLGLQAVAIVGVPTLQFAPFAWFIWLGLGLSVIKQTATGSGVSGVGRQKTLYRARS